ncbi:Transcription-associated recombination protein-Thp1p [Ceraceosorus bombacis]|uniref:Transcription-associated recombination protein-Thp1p n=1 Tax=Ceraceosorus bombacis TaxID=401625 RepID=A0A0P1BBF6_9BASI|nr:Transcription-associated recombination protein-Thp1p [Ceraceosorus bombacis]
MKYNVIHDYLSQVGAAYASRSQDPFTLATLLVVDAQKHALLSHALRAPQNSDLPKKLHTLLRVQKTDRLVPFIDSLFNYLATQPPTAQLVARGPAQLPIQAYRPAFDAWAAVWTKAFAIFSLPDATWFGASLRHFGLVLLHLAVKADKYQVQTSSTKNPCITDAASKVSKAAGLAAIDRTPAAGQETKRREVLWLANLSFYAYFKLNNLRLCDTVLSSVDSAFALNRQFAPPTTSVLAGANADQGESCYSRADRVTYRYYLGRLRLMQHRIRVAHTHLRWAFDNCIVSSRNKVFILVPLLVASLILGHYPTPALLQASGLHPQFGPLVERLRLGDGAGMLQELNRWREWHRSRGIYLLLRERLQTACWRNLIRRT